MTALKDDTGGGRMAGGGGAGGSGGGGGSDAGDNSVPPTAQLKMLRKLQEDVNRCTEAFVKEHPDSKKVDDKAKAELERHCRRPERRCRVARVAARRRRAGRRGREEAMTRRILALLLSALVVTGGLAAFADDPPPDPGDAPLRLKKKPKADDKKAEPPKTDKKADDKKPDDKKPDEKTPETKDEAKEGPAPAEPQEDEKEVMERLSRNVRSVGDRLAKQEINEGTRQLQDDILKDIESLIRHSENPGGGGGAGQQDQNQGEQGQDQNQDQQNQSGGKDSKKSQDKGQGKQGGQGQQSGMQSKGSKSTGNRTGQGQNSQGKGRQRGQLARGNATRRQASGERHAATTGPTAINPRPAWRAERTPATAAGNDKNRADLNRNADLNKQDVWGHLPESMRATMNAYAGRQEFMAKHEALIKKYYSTIATEGRRKGDQP